MNAERLFTDITRSAVSALWVGAPVAVRRRAIPRLHHRFQASATRERQWGRNLSHINPNAQGTEQ